MLRYAETLAVEMKNELNLWSLEEKLQDAVRHSNFNINVG